MKKILYFLLPIMIILIVTFSNLSEKSEMTENLDGEIVKSTNYGYTIKTEASLSEVLERLNAKIVKQENLQNVTVYYCITAANSKFIYEGGKRYNCLISDNGLYVKVGFPLIDTGY